MVPDLFVLWENGFVQGTKLSSFNYPNLSVSLMLWPSEVTGISACNANTPVVSKKKENYFKLEGKSKATF